VPVVDPAASPPPPQEKSTRYVLALGAIGVGGAAIVASAVFALEANWLNHASNRDGHCDDTGCDPEGMDMQVDGATLRLEFPERVKNGNELRKMLVRLAGEARAKG